MQEKFKCRMRECRIDHDQKKILLKAAYCDIEKFHAQQAHLFGPRRMEAKIYKAAFCAMEIQNYHFTMQTDCQYADPSDYDKLAPVTPGDRIRLGNSPHVYRIKHNRSVNLRILAKLMVHKVWRSIVSRKKAAAAEDHLIRENAQLQAKIRLNRVWTYGDENLRVYKFPRQHLFGQFVSSIGDFASGNLIAQSSLKCQIRILAFYRQRLKLVAGSLDPGSDTQYKLTAHVLRLDKKIIDIGHSLYHTFNLQNGLGLHRLATECARGLFFVLSLPPKRVMKAISDATGRREEALDECRSWENSKLKAPLVICCQLRSSANLQKIGTFEIDLNCPLNLTRELLRRTFSTQLNQNTSYDFMDRGSHIKREDEPGIKVHDIATQRLDSETRELDNMLILCPSASEEMSAL